MISQTPAESNRFIALLSKNPTLSKQQLRQLYLAAVKKTHPDAVGSELYSKEFIRYREEYEEACDWLARNSANENDEGLEDNARFAFYRALFHMCECEYLIYWKEMGCSGEGMHRSDEENLEILKEAEALLKGNYITWLPSEEGFYDDFLSSYRYIRTLPFPSTPGESKLYHKIRPLLYNISYYHMTANDFYLKRMNKDFEPLFEELKQGYSSVVRFLRILIKDLSSGAAVLD